MVIGLTNLYPKNEKTKPNNSRGKLCLDILELSNAREVNYFLEDTFDLEKYQKLNIISADKDNAFVSICDKDIKTLPLDKGSHVLTNYNFKQIPKTKREEDSLMDSKYGRERAIELIEDCPIENLDDAIELLKCICSDHKKSNYAGGSEFRKYFTICCHDDEIYPWKTSSSSIIALSKKRD